MPLNPVVLFFPNGRRKALAEIFPGVESDGEGGPPPLPDPTTPMLSLGGLRGGRLDGGGLALVCGGLRGRGTAWFGGGEEAKLDCGGGDLGGGDDGTT